MKEQEAAVAGLQASVGALRKENAGHLEVLQKLGSF